MKLMFPEAFPQQVASKTTAADEIDLDEGTWDFSRSDISSEEAEEMLAELFSDTDGVLTPNNIEHPWS